MLFKKHQFHDMIACVFNFKSLNNTNLKPVRFLITSNKCRLQLSWFLFIGIYNFNKYTFCPGKNVYGSSYKNVLDVKKK